MLNNQPLDSKRSSVRRQRVFARLYFMVDMPTMHAETMTIRRGKRTDLSALVDLLTPGAAALIDKSETRHWRRLAGDPSLDFYVAEHASAIQGVVLVCYIRTLQEHGWQAILDIALASSSSSELARALVSFAKARARQRGCRRLLVLREKIEANGHLTVLQQGGFRPIGDVLSCDL